MTEKLYHYCYDPPPIVFQDNSFIALDTPQEPVIHVLKRLLKAKCNLYYNGSSLVKPDLNQVSWDDVIRYLHTSKVCTIESRHPIGESPLFFVVDQEGVVCIVWLDGVEMNISFPLLSVTSCSFLFILSGLAKKPTLYYQMTLRRVFTHGKNVDLNKMCKYCVKEIAEEHFQVTKDDVSTPRIFGDCNCDKKM